VTAAVVIFVAISSTRASATMNPDQPPQFFQGFAMHIHSALYAHWRGLMAMLYGAEAPDFELADASGKMVRLSDYKGKVVLLNFWATWCAPCKEEIPGFMDLQKQFGDDLVVLGVSLDEDGWTSVRPYVEQAHVSYPVMVADPNLPRPFRKIESVPTTFLIGRNGRIARIQNTLASKSDYEGWIAGMVGASLRQTNTGQ
jgi:cytochrome c biogenesis protein CcmG/thiol:disulfide interchange protein DsbE